MFDIIAPLNAAQVFVPPLNGVEHPLAPAVMNALLRFGNKPVSLWKIVNLLAHEQNPDSRAHRRSWRLRFLCAARELLRFGVLFRHGGYISPANFATRPRAKSPRRSPPSVASSPSKNGGSIPVVPVAKTAVSNPLTSEPKVVVTSWGAPTGTNAMKSGAPTVDEIEKAARTLAQQSRTRKKWSGWLKGERMWRLRPVVVPGGRVLPAYFVRRGFVYVVLPRTPEFTGRIFERYRAADVKVYRSPHAALLGRLPPRAGSRPRGRPRKIVRTTL